MRLLLLGLLLSGCAHAPLESRTAAGQLVVAESLEDDGPRGVVRLFSRREDGAWQADSGPWPAVLGRNGTAWGLGLHPPQRGRRKVEGDGRSPAGRFKLGTVYGTAPALPEGSKNWPYVRKGPRDAWVDDPKLPGYNHFFRFPEGEPLPDWFESQRMRPEIAVLRWSLFVEHNYPDAKPGMGSAVFIHLWHGPDDRTSACVALPEERMLELLRWLDPAAKSELVLLSARDHRRLWKAWGLPSPEEVVRP